MNTNELKTIIEKNQKVTKENLENILIPFLKKLPVPEVTVNNHTFIERAINIDKSQEPSELSRLSYIPDKIKYLAKQGRFNKESESVFYGAFTDLDEPEITRYFLACEIEQDLLEKYNCKFKFITSKWITIDSFTAVLFIFDEKFCGNSLTKEAYNGFQNDKIYQSLTDTEKELLKLITFELGKPKPVNGYLISNILFDFYKEKGYKAIVYPGVQSHYKGNNIAILPEYVDKYLSFYMGAEFELDKVGKKINIDNKYGIKLKDDKLEYFKFKPEELGENNNYPA